MDIKKLITVASIVLGLFAAGCSKETKDDMDHAGDQIKDAAESTGDAMKSAADDTAKALKENEAPASNTDKQAPTHSQ